MADIRFEFDSKGLEQIKKLMEELDAMVQKINDTIAKTGTVTTDQAAQMKRAAIEAKKLENEKKKIELSEKRIEASIEKQNAAAKESKGIIGSLEKQVSRYRSEWKSAQDEASKNKAAEALKNVQKELEKAKGSTNTWGKALDSFQFKFNALGNIAANVLSRMTTQARQFAKESVMMAAQAEGISAAFQKLNNPNLLNDLRRATRGAVSDVSLMKAAVQANNFKIPLDQLATLLKFAGDRALQTGEDFNFLTESIVRGLGRKSVLILDNLGLSVAEMNAEAAKTGDFFRGVSNVIQREMSAAGDVLDTTATKIAQLNAQLQNAKTFLGSKIIEGSGLIKGFSRLSELTESNASAWEKFNAAFDYDSDEGFEKLKREMNEVNQYLSYGAELDKSRARTMAKLVDESTKEAETLESLNVKIENLNLEKQKTNIEDTKTISNLNRQIEDTEKLIEKLNQLGVSKKEASKEFLSEMSMFEDEELEGFDFGLPKPEDFKKNIEEINNLVMEAAEVQGKEIDARERKELDSIERRKEAQKELYGSIMGFASSLSTLLEANKQRELSAAGDNAAKREQIERAYLKKQQALSISEAIIGGSVAAVNALKLLPNPLAFVLAGLATAQTVAEIAVIKAQKFAKGGEVGGALHSQGGTLIEAERGEFVINRRSAAKHRKLIEGINDDDQIKIMASLNMDKRLNIGRGQVDYTRKLYDLLRDQETGYETPEFYVIRKGTKTVKLRK